MILYKKYVKAYRIIDNMYYDMRVRRYFDTSFDIIVSYNNRDFSVLRTLEITTYNRYSALSVNSHTLYLLMDLLYHALIDRIYNSM